MNVGEHEIISVDEIKFKMVLTYEEDGYYSVHRLYDLFCGKKRVAKGVPSIKSCYVKAMDFLHSKGK